MMDAFIRNLRIVLRAETLIAEARLRLALKRFSAKAVAIVIGLFGLAMLNLSLFFALAQDLGNVYAALILSGADCVLATLVFNWARGLEPGPEVELAQEVSHSAMAELEDQTAEMQNDVRKIRDEVLAVRSAVGGFARSPMDSALTSLIGPLISMIVKALTSRSKKD